MTTTTTTDRPPVAERTSQVKARVTPDVNRAARVAAITQGTTIQAVIETALVDLIASGPRTA